MEITQGHSFRRLVGKVGTVVEADTGFSYYPYLVYFSAYPKHKDGIGMKEEELVPAGKLAEALYL